MSNHIEDSPMACLGQMPNPEPRLKRAWRWILQAYGRPYGNIDPATYLLAAERTRQPWEGHSLDKPTVKAVYAKDAIYAEVKISLSFLDKLRLLLGCSLQVNSVIYCENPPGRVKTEPNVFATFD